jgi:hypothetical protein
MVDELRRRWRADLSFAEITELRDEFDSMLHHIRSSRRIRPPVIRCTRCGHVGPAAEPDVSVRSMIIALGRFVILSAEQVKVLERRWAVHPRDNGLDLHGKPPGITSIPTYTCRH